MKFDKQDGSWNYLTSLPIHSLTLEKLEEIKKSVEEKRSEVLKIEATEPVDMYKDDLLELKKKILKSVKNKS